MEKGVSYKTSSYMTHSHFIAANAISIIDDRISQIIII